MFVINTDERNTMDSLHYYCDIYYLNTGTREICDDEIILELSGFPHNV